MNEEQKAKMVDDMYIKYLENMLTRTLTDLHKVQVKNADLALQIVTLLNVEYYGGKN